MKLKSLLPAIAIVAAGITATAVVPIHFRDAVGDAADGGGHMVFPFVEGTEKYNEAAGIAYGDAQFAEDGSIEVRPYDKMNSGLGLYFRTQKLGRTEVEGPVPPEYTIFAMDYKSNLASNDMVLFFHEGCPEPPQVCNGSMIKVTDTYLSTYFPIVRSNAENAWGSEATWANNYNWVSFNDANVKTPDWRLTVKNLRLLTVAEAEAECAAAEGDYEDVFACANGDVAFDTDPDMDNARVYFRTEGAANPVLMTSGIVKPIPAANTKFTFEYIFVGAEPCTLAFHAVQGGTYSTTNFLGAATPTLEVSEDAATAEWKTYEADMSDLIANYNFGQKFGCGDFLHVQLKGLAEGNLLYLRNPKWVTPNGGAVEIIEGIDENAPVEYFNLQGVRVAEPANGLYIKRQGSKTVKVLVK